MPTEKKMKNIASTVLRSIVPPLLLVSSGFILCMHWFLLMADNQSAGITAEVIPAPVIASIMAYYSVVFGPMTWLIKVFILLMFATILLQLFIREIPRALSWAVALTNIPLIINGVFHIIPLVDHFILNTETPEVQSQIIRTVQISHVVSAYGTAFMILIQLIIIYRLMQRTETK